MSDQNFIAAIHVDDLEEGKPAALVVAGQPVLICKSGGDFFAIANRCSHADEPLACGRIRNGWIACPAHGARFDLETGEALTGPAVDPIAIYALRVINGMIEIAL